LAGNEAGVDMIAGTRIAAILIGYALAVFLALHLIFGIEFWQAILWTLITVVTSAILLATMVFSL